MYDMSDPPVINDCDNKAYRCSLINVRKILLKGLNVDKNAVYRLDLGCNTSNLLYKPRRLLVFTL